MAMHPCIICTCCITHWVVEVHPQLKVLWYYPLWLSHLKSPNRPTKVVNEFAGKQQHIPAWAANQPTYATWVRLICKCKNCRFRTGNVCAMVNAGKQTENPRRVSSPKVTWAGMQYGSRVSCACFSSNCTTLTVPLSSPTYLCAIHAKAKSWD